ncbi:MAG: SH3 domain-containing protein [Candidatus Krumholzibacteria bacterium]|nr:SH3 domain-containing protein [Candidatus Krumholzibacteria bacterium]
MTTDVQTEAPAMVDETSAESEAPVEVDRIESAELRAEVASLLEITKGKLKRDNHTPCPACTLLVDIQANRCPHCDSFIAANNALMRESLRRLNEIRAELDGRHGEYVDDLGKEPAKPPLRERIKRFFSSPRAQRPSEPAGLTQDVTAPRLLRNTAEGDPLRVLETDGPWYKVKTRDGQTGWVYSTLVQDR